MKDQGWSLTWAPSVATLAAYQVREVQLCASNRRHAPELRREDMLVTSRTWVDASEMLQRGRS